MTTKHQPLCKNIPMLAFAIFLFLFSNCSSYDEDITQIEVTFTDETLISFGKDGGTKSIEVKSNKDWTITKGADANWIKVSPTKGTEGVATVTINVESNVGDAREGLFTIIASDSEKTITVTQNGKDGSAFEYTTIREIRALYADIGQKQLHITQPLKLKGVVISDAEGGNNLSPNEGFIQDEAEDGIAYRVANQSLPFVMGDRLFINLAGSTISINNGILQLNFSAERVKVEAQDVVVEPKELSIKEILSGSYDATLVKIMDAQFRIYENLSFYEGKGSVTNRALESNNNTNIIVRTAKSATFKDEPLPVGKGNIVGIVSQINGLWSIAMRNLNDASEMSSDASSRFVMKEPPADSPQIITDVDIVNFGSKGGNETINITTNVNWTVKSNESWLTVAPNSGNNNGTIIVSATENEGDERRAIITIAGSGITKAVQVTQHKEAVDSNTAKDLFFSEYVEGKSYNKYLEIYNGTGKAVDLSDYKVAIYINGQEKAKYTEELSGILEDGEVVVLQHPKSVIYNGVTIESTSINFNGNDAIALVKISTESYVDIIGCIGHDPGSKGWIDPSDKELSTLDKTLVRKPSVREGVTDNPYEGFPTLGHEWISYPVDTADYLGSHTMN